MSLKWLAIVFLSTGIAFSGGATMFTSGERIPGDIIVKYRTRTTGIAEMNSSVVAVRSFMKGSLGVKKIKSLGKLNVDHLELESYQNLDATLEDLRALPEVEFAEPDYIVRAVEISGDIARSTPNLSSQSWGLLNIEANLAWEITPGDENVIVAIIDSGIDYYHEDLVNNIWINPAEDINHDGICDENDFDGHDQDNNGFVDDCVGWNFVNKNNDPYDDLDHGTHVAGIVGGVGENEVFGVSRILRLMAVKFIAGDGYGTTSDAIQAILYAVNNGARILNNSWGGADYSKALKEAIEYSNSRDTLFLAAAGNTGTNNDSDPHYPSNYSVVNVISVGASNVYNDMPYFSNYGRDSVDLIAPGEFIYSTITENGYSIYSGTSMATPFVSGIAALVLATHPNTSNFNLKRTILESTDSFSFLSGKILTGGRANAFEALSLAASGLEGPPRYPMTSTLQDPNELGREVSSPMGCGRISGQTGKDPSDRGTLIIVLMLPLLIVIARKHRKRAVARLGRNICRYFLNYY